VPAHELFNSMVIHSLDHHFLRTVTAQAGCALLLHVQLALSSLVRLLWHSVPHLLDADARLYTKTVKLSAACGLIPPDEQRIGHAHSVLARGAPEAGLYTSLHARLRELDAALAEHVITSCSSNYSDATPTQIKAFAPLKTSTPAGIHPHRPRRRLLLPRQTGAVQSAHHTDRTRQLARRHREESPAPIHNKWIAADGGPSECFCGTARGES
jgi:hypothetical protein